MMSGYFYAFSPFLFHIYLCYTFLMKKFQFDQKKIQKHWQKMKKEFQSGEHHLPAFIGVIVLLLVLTGVRVVTLTAENNQLEAQQAHMSSQIDKLAGIQGVVVDQLAFVATASQADLESFRELTEEKLAEARDEIESARVNLEGRIDSQSSAFRNVIKTWQGRIPLVECTFARTNSEGVKSFSSTRGAGTLFSIGESPTLLTNRHVLEESKEELQTCKLVFPDGGEDYVFQPSAISLHETGDADFGKVALADASAHIAGRLAKKTEICSNGASIGDEIVILGYPSIGSEETITATEGIISGRENDFFITSAKVERGNSGGAAILVQENCYLGIPTFTAAGKVESLARILDARSVSF